MSGRHMRYIPSMPDAYVGAAADDDNLGDGGATQVNTARTATQRFPAQPPTPVAVAPTQKPLRRVAAPSQPYETSAYVAPRPSVGPARRVRTQAAGMRSPSVVSVALRAAAMVIRATAIMVCLLVAANAVAVGFARLPVLGVTSWVSDALPTSLAGSLTLPTIVGGSFRGDLAISAIILFVCDWACVRLAARLST